jgi:2,5-diamino-6-(ribosylamino)-4(3H)-pyrimidinone 5'-phosphate reductase
MVPSVDGRIVTERWRLPSAVYAEYERTARTFKADAWIIGRVSMEPYAGKARVPTRKPSKPIGRTDFIARREAASYAVAVDPSGKLRWQSSSIDGEHVITVLTERVTDAYLAFLRTKGVSYIFGGRRDVNLRRVLEKLRSSFGIERLLLEGGGKINGSFLAANLIDQLSVLVAPIADGGIGTPTLFDSEWGQGPGRHLSLHSIKRCASDLIWLRYKVRRIASG